jgi:isopentenyl phosphate kinase
MKPGKLTFLKLGGSLITDKDKPHTVKPQTLARLAREIAAAIEQEPEISLLVGHGSGSFAHVPASRYQTRLGVQTAEEWRGFLAVWSEAFELHTQVIRSLHEAGIPAVSFSPSAMIMARSGRVLSWDTAPIRSALLAGLVPVVYGDAIFDDQIGGTILSTEELFSYLARQLHPDRLLIAGIEPGVWADYPERQHLIGEIRPVSMEDIYSHLSGSSATDVTGGMASKVVEMVELVQVVPGLEVLIFSGMEAGLTVRVMTGEAAGTRISNR